MGEMWIYSITYSFIIGCVAFLPPEFMRPAVSLPISYDVNSPYTSGVRGVYF
jgi:hypothetical protein